MKNLKYTAFMLAATMTLAAVGCSSQETKNTTPTTDNINASDRSNSNNSSNKSQPMTHAAVNANSADVGIGSVTSLNSTSFSLDSVIRTDVEGLEGYDYVFVGVTIKNETDTEYEISSLNNFFLTLPDGSEVSSDIRPKMYAMSTYSKAAEDPIVIPASGEFSGYVAGGFLVPDDVDSFKVHFIPTLNNPNNKSNIITCDVSADNISTDDSPMK